MSKGWYALRRTLPPWNVEQNINDLVTFCQNNHVDEVIAKVDSEEFTHGLPPVEWLDDYLNILRTMQKEITRIGVLFSINPWVTLVHCDRGRDIEKTHEGIGLFVGHDGVSCKGCACPLSNKWQSVTKELWHRYASLKPHVLWIEDDIRLLNHEPVEYGCFCDLHLMKFSKRIGTGVSRDKLVQALIAPGSPHPYRQEWLDMNRQITADTFRFFESCVHEVSPDTHLGLMCSPPSHHAAEGRNWKSTVDVLSNGTGLYIRPCMGNYIEQSPRGLYESGYLVRATLDCVGPGVNIQTEIENYPFTTYSKSASFTFLQMALSFALGADGVTLNLFDHMGTPMAIVPEYGEMMRAQKAFLNALADRCHGGKAAGIRLLQSADAAYWVQTEDRATYLDIIPDGQAWRHALEPLGFSVTFGDSSIVALTDQVARGFSDNIIRRILSGGVLLDLTALKSLIDLGYQDLLGVGIKREFNKHSEPLSAELYSNPKFGGADHKYMTLTLPGIFGDVDLAEISPTAEAHVVSYMVNPDSVPVYPFLTLYENSLGGRVAVFPVDIETAAGVAFLNVYRRQQMEIVCRWLARDKIPLLVNSGAYPLPIRIDGDGYSIISIFNLSLDVWPKCSFEVYNEAQVPSKIESLRGDGMWDEDPAITWRRKDNSIEVEIKEPIPSISLKVLTIWWDQQY